MRVANAHPGSAERLGTEGCSTGGNVNLGGHFSRTNSGAKTVLRVKRGGRFTDYVSVLFPLCSTMDPRIYTSSIHWTPYICLCCVIFLHLTPLKGQLGKSNY